MKNPNTSINFLLETFELAYNAYNHSDPIIKKKIRMETRKSLCYLKYTHSLKLC